MVDFPSPFEGVYAGPIGCVYAGPDMMGGNQKPILGNSSSDKYPQSFLNAVFNKAETINDVYAGPDVMAQESAASRFCAECGAKVDESARFCIECGAPVNRDE